MTDAAESLSILNEQLLAIAEALAPDARALSALLEQLVRDVERAMAEPLDIFPVCHHSPASALHMVRRLQTAPPKAIYMEMCEDMLPLIENLSDCGLPVALQAFAAESDALPSEALPVTVVAPLTEASAEYQAIAYALTHPETQLVFVDRAVDYIFQWDAEWKKQVGKAGDEQAAERENAAMHGSAVGVAPGDLTPTFDEFTRFLLRNSNTRHFAEWWDQYVERGIVSADYAIYKQVMTLMGSLIRHIGRRGPDVETDLLRERYMWTRIKSHMSANGIRPEDAIYVCGAAHAASDAPEYGALNPALWDDLPPVTATRWLYGLIPSSFAAIEYQFGNPAGTASLAEGAWEKSLRAEKLRPFDLKKPDVARKRPTLRETVRAPRVLAAFMTRPPAYASEDDEQLLAWCVQIVALARRNGYLASTADSIAIYETSVLLAQMRSRQHPTPYDFQDAAITCLEKDRTPRKRNIARLCQILLGGDRVGTVGYSALPPLVQDVYDRLAPLGVDLFSKTNQRALMDFKARPELRACSDILWKLRYLLGDVVRPIVGEKKLGETPVQESWDVRLGKHQREIIQLGYEGVTLEQVLEQRMKAAAFAEDATAAAALRTAEDALLYMQRPRLVREIGLHAVALLEQETDAADAPDIFQRARRLVHYYRATPDGLPDWLERLVVTGYAHYAALLPQAFGSAGTTPEQIAGMLGFIFTLESLALALGCRREQLVIGLQGAAHVDVPPDKIGLLWTAEWLLGMRGIGEMRAFLTAILDDTVRLPALPRYLNGFVLALTFAPGIARFVVELLSQIFGAVKDATLLPWLPSLILQLREHQPILLPLVKEASAVFPPTLAGFDRWRPAWLQDSPDEAGPDTDGAPNTALPPEMDAARAALLAHPAALDALAAWIGRKNDDF